MSQSLLEEPQNKVDNSKVTAASVWQVSGFRQKFWITTLIVAIILVSMPHFFNFIQNRPGPQLNDWLLGVLPVVDCSWPIFFAMYSLSIYAVYRSFHNPLVFYKYASVYILITLCRAVTIYVYPLDPPSDLVSLTDPFLSIFYGGKEITRDLFFSGHTSSMLLMFLAIDTRFGKIYGMIVTISVAVMLLLQHIHYTADVLVAFPATFLFWRLAKPWTDVKIEN
jgi:hypothetical protein